MKKLNLTSKKLFTLIITLFLLVFLSLSTAAFSNYEKDVASKLYKNLEEEYEITEFDQQSLEYKTLKKLEANIINRKFKNEEFKLHHIDDKLINAYYIGDGNIMLFEGLLQKLKTEDQLAGLVAHEMGHAVEEHLTEDLERNMSLSILNILFNHFTENDYQLMTNIAQNLIANGYSREQEQESDIYAVDLMLRSGYDPDGLIELMKIFKENSHNVKLLEFTQTHPIPDSRIDYLREYIAEKKSKSTVKNKEESREINEANQKTTNQENSQEDLTVNLDNVFKEHNILFSYPKEWTLKKEKVLQKEVVFKYNIEADNLSGGIQLEDLSQKTFMQTAKKQFIYTAITAEENGAKVKKNNIENKKLDIYQIEIIQDNQLFFEYFISEKNEQQLLKLRFEINRAKQNQQTKLIDRLIQTIRFQ
ncbi:M48 family metallopeptidase [Halanaerobium saccharolyticum]|uniref:M48 family metallopeptidase n=1 Tax=Halanaerobium saccharolyticum TaxID=43595 RepID=UPI00135F152F|nr:M48 family metallopeptidase [Halanaerobium saccharolyticum]